MYFFIAKNKRKKKRDLFGVLSLIYAGILLLSGIFGDMGIIKNFKLYKQNEIIKENISLLEKENAKFRREIDNLLVNPRYIEKVAREELNMSRDDEITFIFLSEKEKILPQDKEQKK